ncbi:MAG: hypothetical protein JWR35_198 [Marmoricola sp.]|nr:hypothetical protein [Marmoricola sp.]
MPYGRGMKRFEFWPLNPRLLPNFQVTFMSPSMSHVTLDETSLRVQMGLGFRTTIPRADITSVVRDHDSIVGIGAHGLRGRWLVNTSAEGLVRVEIDPSTRVWVFGWPLRLAELRLSLVEADEFVAEFA